MRRFCSERFDGAVWHTYETDSAYFFLTRQGREAFAGGGLARLLRLYSADLEKSKQDSPEPQKFRRFLAQGGNASVYSLGNYPLVIKERKQGGDDLLAGLSRMDTLVHAVESHAPRWIDIPRHLGVLCVRNKPQEQYLLMQKIDNGVSIGDIMNFPKGPEEAREPALYYEIRDSFDVTADFIDEVTDRYERIKCGLREALLGEHLDPAIYLPDIDDNPNNVLIEKLDTPIGGTSLKYWVIDQ